MGLGELYQKFRVGEDNYNLINRIHSQRNGLEAVLKLPPENRPTASSDEIGMVDSEAYLKMRLAVLEYWSEHAEQATKKEPLRPVMQFYAGFREKTPDYHQVGSASPQYGALATNVEKILGISNETTVNEYIQDVTKSILKGPGRLPKRDS